jgi:hypothetical protein
MDCGWSVLVHGTTPAEGWIILIGKRNKKSGQNQGFTRPAARMAFTITTSADISMLNA